MGILREESIPFVVSGECEIHTSNPHFRIVWISIAAGISKPQTYPIFHAVPIRAPRINNQTSELISPSDRQYKPLHPTVGPVGRRKPAWNLLSLNISNFESHTRSDNMTRARVLPPLSPQDPLPPWVAPCSGDNLHKSIPERGKCRKSDRPNAEASASINVEDQLLALNTILGVFKPERPFVYCRICD